jgi:catechol 2,3-dioxygenase-like lactoylglutathione lyase family enzyme
MRLRSIELKLPDVSEAVQFLTGTWGLIEAERHERAVYLRGAGELPYLVGLFEAKERSVRSLTFTCEAAELSTLVPRLHASGRPVREVESQDPGAGSGFEIELPEGEVFRFLSGSRLGKAVSGRDLPRQLAHVVISASDAESSARFTEEVLGFKVSDRTRGMVFVRCNRSHHCIAFTRAGYSSLNHIAFEMEDIDAVMRGVGRLRDANMKPAWGPGRHGPGHNVFAYFIAPFGAVIEFSTATEIISDDYRVGKPEDWTWPPRRSDHWGLSDKDIPALAEAEKRFRFQRDWPNGGMA